ncbi:MAG: hypothetical protein IJY90_03180 [Clostridia bacterium]|nr:hypothetical protein [Clostridia bacterium]
MKFYYPEFRKENGRSVITVNGKELPSYAEDVRPSALYLRIDNGSYVRFVDYLGNQVGKDYIAATVHNAAGFSRANVSTNMQTKEIYLDIFLRESDKVTRSGSDAYAFFAELYAQERFRPKHQWIATKLEEMPFEYFEDERFYEGMIKMLVKYLRDEAQYAYEYNLEQDSVQIIQESLQRFKDICLEKRQKALEDKKAREEKSNHRQNILNNTVKFLDAYEYDTECDV